MGNNKISMPSSGGGLMRYFDDYKSKIQIKPSYVIVAVIVIIIAELVIQKAL
ncbi:preprotein translocase subunit Sec61beta [archaeon]|jgi:preprotein translocase subunit Sec61beta|nr:preprotein translocase subunit Sec61beta [archaeon]MBT4397746.1 preprotein translocase subunit Sec61beta [archaeon]MBT4441233.1 preprotein translocase subunit Sec61beta [archaeon]